MKKLLLSVGSSVLLSATAIRADSTLVFNEIMYHPELNEPAFEWVEFRNELAVDLDISGWSVSGGIHYSFASNTIVRGRGFLVLAIRPDVLTQQLGVTNVVGPFTGRLGNNGDDLILRNNSGRVVDSIHYGVDGDWPVGPDGSGVSLAKRDRESASGPAENWTVSEQVGGTPGTDNFPLLGVTIPDVRLVTTESEWKYEASGQDLGSAWRDAAYNDASWSSGRAWLYNGNITVAQSRAIPTVFSTGIGTNGAALAPGARDPHYIVTQAAQGTINTNAIAMENNPAWLANDDSSVWINAAVNSGNLNVNAGNYNYRTDFSISGFNPGTPQIQMNIAADDQCTDVLLNGASTGIGITGFASFSPTFTITTGLVQGNNTLEFRTVNGGTGANPEGFRALLRGSGMMTLTNTALPSGSTTYYFRKTFSFTGDNNVIGLRINVMVDDGAVFYLNGAEIYRLNMPDGPINHSTLASADVANPAFSGLISVPSAALKQGTNVLAVEVHQATGGGSDLLFDAELVASATAGSSVMLCINEYASAGGNFWLELANYGTNELDLTDYAIVRDGAVGNVYTLPEGTTLAGNSYLFLTNTTLDFVPAAGDKIYLFAPGRSTLRDAVVVGNRLKGRYPNGSGRWLNPNLPTPGAPNSFAFHNEIVINEIMYNHKLLPPTNNLPARPSPESWLELYNRSGAPVDLTGWRLDGGIGYAFSAGQTIPAGGYLVVADDMSFMRAMYPSIPMVGNFSGRLSGRTDHVILKDPSGNPADEVRYYDGGAWPGYADGGGSSLELRDPDADNSKPEAWAASDESNKTSWQTYTYRWTAVPVVTTMVPTTFNDFILGLLGEGECLVDDISVIESPTGTPVQFIENGDFENGLSGWRVLGTHNRSQVITDPENPGNHVLHVVATSPQEHMHNHIERNYIGGRRITDTREYQISFRARWLTGNHLLNTRLYFNRFARITALPFPALNGTPGAPNSRRENNIGPTFSGLRHQRVVPQPGEEVTVMANAQDPDGVASAGLFWSVDSGAFNSTPMSIGSDGRLVGTIPGYPARSTVQFYIHAVDSLGAAANYPAAGPDSGALYTVADGLARRDLGHNFRIILTPANVALLHASTNVMSNDNMPCTLIYDESRAYYECGGRLKSSERGRDSAARVSFHLTFPPNDLFRGAHPVMLFDRSPGGSSPGQEEIVIRHMLLRAGGIPAPNPDICWLMPPNTSQTGPAILSPRFEDEFAETAFENGGEGKFFELELIYFPLGTNAAGYKLPQPDDVKSVDYQDLGNDKENYRYDFILKNHREEDDYSRFIPFAKMHSLSGSLLEQQARQLMDVDENLRGYALVSLCGVGDMYTYGLPHNWMVYQRAGDNKFLYFPWDMDFSFSRGSGDALVGNSPSTDSRFNKIVNLPANLRRYYAHVLDIINISFNTSYMTYWLDHYDNFAPPQNYTGRGSYITARIAAARAEINANGGTAAFAITGTNVITTSNNLVALTGTAPIAVQTIKVNGRSYPITWTTTSAWRMMVPVFDPTNQLEFVGYDLQGNILTNFVRTVTVNYTGAAPNPAGAIVFNEIMYNPPTPNTAFVELYNRSSFSFDLSQWRINGLDYTFPKGSIITNGQYLLLVNELSAYAAAFGTNSPMPFDEFQGNLQNNGETLTLLRPGTNGGPEVVMAKVKYENVQPWSPAADGQGPSLQLIDTAEDNARVGNWADPTGWRYVTYTGTIQGSPTASQRGTNFFIFLNTAGDVYIDDLKLVLGSFPEVGPNLLVNGDFEAPLAGTWVLTNNHIGTAQSTAVSHSGSGSLHVIASGPGSTTAGYIRQYIPGNTSNATCTLSFWLLPTTNGTSLSIRTAPGSAFNAITPVQPIFATPGAPNTVARDLPPFPALYLNEVQPENVSGPLDNHGEREPWIEIYNSGATDISLDGYYLSDNYASLTQWAFPAGSSIGAGQFRIVFADAEPGESTASEWHANFRPQAGHGSIALSSGVIVHDYLNYTNVRANWSYGAYPDGQLFTRRAFYHTTPAATNDNSAAPITVFINEWMADNNRTLMNTNNNNRFDDWFELYNSSDLPADLTGYALTDNLGDPFQYTIPSGYVIPSHGFLLVWADNQADHNSTNDTALHVNFRLERDGESIALVAPNGSVIDSVTFEPQYEDVSQGRFPDGGDVYFLNAATPKAPNTSWINRYPVLSPIPNQTALVNEPFAYHVTASDPDGNALAFSLDLAPTGAAIDVNGNITWTPSSTGTNAMTVRVTDDGALGLSVARSFEIVVTTGIRIGNITRTSPTDLAISLSATPGKTYRAEFKDNLDDPTWTPILPGTVAQGSTVVITIPIGPEPHRFYHVVQVN